MTTEWLNAVWPGVRKGYAGNGIVNGDETGIFFRLTPDKERNVLAVSSPKTALWFCVLLQMGLRRGNCL